MVDWFVYYLLNKPDLFKRGFDVSGIDEYAITSTIEPEELFLDLDTNENCIQILDYLCFVGDHVFVLKFLSEIG